jgi:GT2 family glycosyltransferase
MDVPVTTTLGPAPAAAPARSAAWPALRRLGPRLSVVIVNYLHWRDTAHLVRQLRTAACLRQGQAEVVVVDNHSPADAVVPRLRRLPELSLRRWRRNRGFARAVNEGCRLSQGEWLLLLNPDMTLPEGFLDEVLARADRLVAEEPTAGIAGFGLRNPDGGRQLSTGRFPTLARSLAGLLLPRWRRKYAVPRPARPGGRGRVDWVTGCCLLVRRACWSELGGFDPAFFLYYEDVDLCRRARERGWTVWYEPTPSAVHHHPLHGREVPAHLRVITRHALLTYARKHWPPGPFRALAGIVRVEAWLRRLGARWRGDAGAARDFAELGRVAADLARGRAAGAGRRVQRVVRRQEGRRADACAGPVDRGPQPQPARPAPALPGERGAAGAARHGGAGGG